MYVRKKNLSGASTWYNEKKNIIKKVANKINH